MEVSVLHLTPELWRHQGADLTTPWPPCPLPGRISQTSLPGRRPRGRLSSGTPRAAGERAPWSPGTAGGRPGLAGVRPSELQSLLWLEPVAQEERVLYHGTCPPSLASLSCIFGPWRSRYLKRPFPGSSLGSQLPWGALAARGPDSRLSDRPKAAPLVAVLTRTSFQVVCDCFLLAYWGPRLQKLRPHPPAPTWSQCVEGTCFANVC